MHPKLLRTPANQSNDKTRLRILPKSALIRPERVQIYRIALLIIASVPVGAENFQASGFSMRNHAPFSALIGIPNGWPDGTDHSAELSWNTSNHSMREVSGDELLMLDGETQTLSARIQNLFPNSAWH
jgi:hypothetical protein